jgi:OHCU decarboxylase
MNKTITLELLNMGATTEITEFLARTLFSRELADLVMRRRPFADIDQLIEGARIAWEELSVGSKQAAFNAHPRIGDIREVSKRQHSKSEQQGIYAASRPVLQRLVTLNRKYEKTFGFRFLLLASGKTANEMLSLLELRLKHLPEEEVAIASLEKLRINELRLRQVVIGG